MNGKSKNVVVIIYAVISAMYTVLFLAAPFERNATTWIAFAFGCVSILAGAIAAFIAFDKGDSLKSKIYGFPIFRLGYYYTTIQLILTIALFIAEFFVDIPSWISVIFGVLLLGVFIIGVVSIDNVRDIVEQQDKRSVSNTQTMETIKREVDSLVRKCSDEETKKELEKLSEEIRYSDPLSNEETKGIESDIILKISELGIQTNTKENKNSISDIRELLARRNDICKESKK